VFIFKCDDIRSHSSSLEYHDNVSNVPVNSKGTMAVTGNMANAISVWKLKDGTYRYISHVLIPFTLNKATKLTIYPHCDLVLGCYCLDQTIRFHRGWVRAIAFSSDDCLFAAGSYDHSV
jgi:WD40 repeat protein